MYACVFLDRTLWCVRLLADLSRSRSLCTFVLSVCAFTAPKCAQSLVIWIYISVFQSKSTYFWCLLWLMFCFFFLRFFLSLSHSFVVCTSFDWLVTVLAIANTMLFIPQIYSIARVYCFECGAFFSLSPLFATPCHATADLPVSRSVALCVTNKSNLLIFLCIYSYSRCECVCVCDRFSWFDQLLLWYFFSVFWILSLCVH